MLQKIDVVGVSVVIVTYNGKDRLQKTLEHIAQQKDIDFNWELLLIDNNSTDGTLDYVQKTWTALGSPCPLRIIVETRPGTSYARNSGICNARYRYMLFCDDDNWLHEGYVNISYQKIVQNNQIAAVGGYGVLEFAKDFTPPNWIEKYKNYYGCGPQGKRDGDTTLDKGCLYTAGALLDRYWLDKLYSTGFKPTLTGRIGKDLLAGEDTELTYGLVLLGGKLHYYSDLKFKHFMPANRMQWDYLNRLSKAVGVSNYILKSYHSRENYFFDFPLTVLLLIKYFIKSLVGGFDEGNQNVIYYHQFRGQLKAVRMDSKYHLNIVLNKEKIKNAL